MKGCHRDFRFHSGTYIGVHYHFGKQQWVALMSRAPGHLTHYGWGTTKRQAVQDLKQARVDFVMKKMGLIR